MPKSVCFVAARGTTTVTIAAPPTATGMRPRRATTTTAFASLPVRIRSVIGIGKRDFAERIWRVQGIVRRCWRQFPKIQLNQTAW